jgi:hypothetical protein
MALIAWVWLALHRLLTAQRYVAKQVKASPWIRASMDDCLWPKPAAQVIK